LEQDVRIREIIKTAIALFAVAFAFVAPIRASEQSSYVIPGAGPHTMADLTSNYFNPAFRALAACNWGTSAPANGPSAQPLSYETWCDTTTNPVVVKMYDGASWVVIGKLNTASHIWTPEYQGTDTGTASTATIGSSGHTLGFLDAANTWSATQTFTLNQNAQTAWAVTNNSAGTAAFAGFSASNTNGAGIFGVGGAGYTAFTGGQNRAFVFSQSVLSGIAIWADGANPINFYNNGSLSGAFSSAGVFSLTTPLAAGSGGTGISALGTGVATALGVNVGSAGAFVTFNGALGTPSSGVGTNLTGTASGLTAGNVTTNANMTGDVTSVGNAATIGANKVTRTMQAQGVARSIIGVTGNATANVADIQGTASQFFGVNSAGTALAFQTMTGDVTLSGPASTIAANAVTNAKMATMAANTIKANATGSSAVPTDVSIPALTQKVSPVAADKIMIADSAASDALKYATVSSIASAGSVSSIAGNTGAFTLSNGITNSTNDIRLNVGHLPGEASNGNAAAGEIGEYISSSVASGSAVSLTTGVTVNVTSISLTAGDWDLRGGVFLTNVGTPTALVGAISTVSATVPALGTPTESLFQLLGSGFTVGATQVLPLGTSRQSLSGTTTFFLVAIENFTGGAATAYGKISARRVR
jgi:hypothetical protein